VESADLVDGHRDERFRYGAAVGLGSVGLEVGGGDGEPGMGEHGEGDVSVPGVPEADLIVVEADLVLAGLEALLDGPADTDDGDQVVDGGAGLGVADEVGELGGVAEGAADEQPVVGLVVPIRAQS
jgi:hypothetical protein